MENFKADKLEKWGYLNIWQLCKEGLSTAMQNFHGFWQSVIDAWSKIIQHPTTAPTEILRQPLWNNNEIIINKQRACKPYCIKREYSLLIISLKTTEIFFYLKTFNCILLSNFLAYNGLIAAIPKHWKQLIMKVLKEEICHGSTEKWKKGAISI